METHNSDESRATDDPPEFIIDGGLLQEVTCAAARAWYKTTAQGPRKVDSVCATSLLSFVSAASRTSVSFSAGPTSRPPKISPVHLRQSGSTYYDLKMRRATSTCAPLNARTFPCSSCLRGEQASPPRSCSRLAPTSITASPT